MGQVQSGIRMVSWYLKGKREYTRCGRLEVAHDRSGYLQAAKTFAASDLDVNLSR
jgi:hypothetical protein